MSSDVLPEPERTSDLIEHRTITQVPENERNGSSRGLFGIWFGVNMLPITVITGAISTTVFGLPFWWGLLAIVIGNVVGGVLMALHASQGPTLGVPQMLQARGQFGSKGASLLVLVAIVMFVGFFISGAIVAAQSFHLVTSSISLDAGITIAVIASLVVTLFGLRILKVVISISAITIGIVVFVTFVKVLAHGVPNGTFTHGRDCPRSC